MDANSVTDLVLFLVRLSAGGILLAAGVLKLVAGQALVSRLVAAYGLLPERGIVAVARVLPALETGLGLLLVTGTLVPLAGAAAALLLLAFSGAIAVALRRGGAHDCGCFGQAQPAQPLRWSLVARNLLMAAGLAAVVGRGRSGPALDGLLGLPVRVALAALLLAAVGSFGSVNWRRPLRVLAAEEV